MASRKAPEVFEPGGLFDRLNNFAPGGIVDERIAQLRNPQTAFSPGGTFDQLIADLRGNPPPTRKRPRRINIKL